MIKHFILGITLLGVAACTGHIKENNFITQDDVSTNFLSSEIESWDKEFKQHRIQPIEIVTKNDSTVLRGIYLKHTSSNDVIFYIPGNGMKVSKGGMSALKKLAKLDKSIVIFDRRGLGASEGKATISTLITDATAQLAFIKNSLKPNTIVVHGYSLGSFVAAQIAKTETIDALVMQGSATNVDEWIDEKMPWYSKPFLTIEVDEAFHTVDNKDVLASYYKGPLLVIGGEEDEQVPVELSKSLYSASQSAHKKLMLVEKANHQNMLDGDDQISVYKQFLTTIN